MNFSTSLCINHGPRAGMPRPVTDINMDQQRAVRSLTVTLKRNGIAVLSSHTSANVPATILVVAGPQTDEMIALGQARYIASPADACGARTIHGEFWRDGVCVMWIEDGVRS